MATKVATTTGLKTSIEGIPIKGCRLEDVSRRVKKANKKADLVLVCAAAIFVVFGIGFTVLQGIVEFCFKYPLILIAALLMIGLVRYIFQKQSNTNTHYSIETRSRSDLSITASFPDLVTTGLSGKNSQLSLLKIDAYEFEHLVALLFTRLGFETKVTKTSGDGGIDCIAIDHRPMIGGKIVIQAKRYRGTVGVSAVRELYGVMQHEGANKGVIVTTGSFSAGAAHFAQGKPLELVDGEALLRRLQEVGIEAVM